MENITSDLSKVVDATAEGFYKIGKEAKDISEALEGLRKNLVEAVGIDPEILSGDYAIGPDDIFSVRQAIDGEYQITMDTYRFDQWFFRNTRCFAYLSNQAKRKHRRSKYHYAISSRSMKG